MSEIAGALAGVAFAIGYIVGGLVMRRRLTRKVAQAIYDTERQWGDR